MTEPSRSPAGSERRRARRLPVTSQFDARTEPDAQPVTIRDVSTGGFLLESPEPFRVDAIHEFRVATSNGQWETRITARSVHCRRHGDANGTPTYLTGFAFVAPVGSEAEERLHEMVNRVTSVVSY